jgi:hypothetical protein
MGRICFVFGVHEQWGLDGHVLFYTTQKYTVGVTRKSNTINSPGQKKTTLSTDYKYLTSFLLNKLKKIVTPGPDPSSFPASPVIPRDGGRECISPIPNGL